MHKTITDWVNSIPEAKTPDTLPPLDTSLEALTRLLDFYAAATAHIEKTTPDTERLERAMKVTIALSSAVEAHAALDAAQSMRGVKEAVTGIGISLASVALKGQEGEDGSE